MGEEPVPPPAAALALLPHCAPKAGWKATAAVVAVAAALCPDDGHSRGNAPGTGSRRSGSTQGARDLRVLLLPVAPPLPAPSAQSCGWKYRRLRAQAHPLQPCRAVCTPSAPRSRCGHPESGPFSPNCCSAARLRKGRFKGPSTSGSGARASARISCASPLAYWLFSLCL